MPRALQTVPRRSWEKSRLDRVRDPRAELPLQQIEREIQAGGDARAGHQIAVVDDTGLDGVAPRRRPSASRPR